MTLFSYCIMAMSQFASPLLSTIALLCLTSAAQILLCGLLIVIGSSCLLSKVGLPRHEGSNAHFYDAWHIPSTNMIFHVSGMPQISPIFASAAAVKVPTVFGDGLKDSLGDGLSASAVVVEDVSPPSSCSPPPDMASTFMSHVRINPDTWGESKRLGPSTVPVVSRLTTPASILSGLHAL